MDDGMDMVMEPPAVQDDFSFLASKIALACVSEDAAAQKWLAANLKLRVECKTYFNTHFKDFTEKSTKTKAQEGVKAKPVMHSIVLFSGNSALPFVFVEKSTLYDAQPLGLYRDLDSNIDSRFALQPEGLAREICASNLVEKGLTPHFCLVYRTVVKNLGGGFSITRYTEYGGEKTVAQCIKDDETYKNSLAFELHAKIQVATAFAVALAHTNMPFYQGDLHPNNVVVQPLTDGLEGVSINNPFCPTYKSRFLFRIIDFDAQLSPIDYGLRLYSPLDSHLPKTTLQTLFKMRRFALADILAFFVMMDSGRTTMLTLLAVQYVSENLHKMEEDVAEGIARMLLTFYEDPPGEGTLYELANAWQVENLARRRNLKLHFNENFETLIVESREHRAQAGNSIAAPTIYEGRVTTKEGDRAFFFVGKSTTYRTQDFGEAVVDFAGTSIPAWHNLDPDAFAREKTASDLVEAGLTPHFCLVYRTVVNRSPGEYVTFTRFTEYAGAKTVAQCLQDESYNMSLAFELHAKLQVATAFAVALKHAETSFFQGDMHPGNVVVQPLTDSADGVAIPNPFCATYKSRFLFRIIDFISAFAPIDYGSYYEKEKSNLFANVFHKLYRKQRFALADILAFFYQYDIRAQRKNFSTLTNLAFAYVHQNSRRTEADVAKGLVQMLLTFYEDPPGETTLQPTQWQPTQWQPPRQPPRHKLAPQQPPDITSKQASGTMSCITPARRSCSTFRGSGLGFSTACVKETCGTDGRAACAPCVDPCAAPPPNRAARLCNNVSHPHAYDAMALPGLMAFPFTHSASGPQTMTAVMTTRIVRAVARGGWTYACGYAAVPANSNDGPNEWTDEGFVCMLRMGAATGAVAPTPTNVCVLRSVDALGVTQRLLLPRGLVTAQATCVVVVGNGDAEYADGDTASAGPAIAVVPVSGCGGIGSGPGGGNNAGAAAGSSCAVLPAPTVYVFTYLGDGAAFFDAMWHHDNPSWLVVAGSLDGNAVLWTIDVTTWAIVQTVTLLAGSVNATQLNAVSVTHVCGMYVAGVHVWERDEEDAPLPAPTQSLLWPVADGSFTTLAPWLATSYNEPSTDTPRLRLAAGASTVLLLRVFGVANTGALLAAALVGFDQSSGAPLPAHGAATYAFTADTAPDPAFGVDGVVTWFDAELGTTRPTDAVLLLASECAPAVAAVGSAFATEVVTPELGAAPVVDVPGFPYLNVYMAADEDGALPVPAPVPFAVTMGATGVTTLVRGLGAAHDCCSPPYRWLGAVAQPAPNALALLGDVCWHPGCTSQSATLLAVFLALSCPPRILNGQTVAVPVIANNCDGRVEVDARCAPTTLLVRGGIVLGCDALPLPGSLRFNVQADTLEVYTQGGLWRAVALEALP